MEFNIFFILGNLAFVCTGIGYSMSKMIYLRSLIALGSIMTILYGFYGTKNHILWLEIFWALVMLSINSIFICLYLRDYYKCTKIHEKYFAIHLAYFKKITRMDFYNIIKKSHFKSYNKNELIIQKGTKNKNLYLIIKGDVAISLNDKIVSQCTVGDFLGEFSVLYAEETSASVQCISDEVECLIWPGKSIAKFKHPLYEIFSNCVNQNIVKKIKKHNEVG